MGALYPNGPTEADSNLMVASPAYKRRAALVAHQCGSSSVALYVLTAGLFGKHMHDIC